MRNTLILLILVSIGLTTPALAKESKGWQQHNSDQRRSERVEHSQNRYARHDRRDEKYGHFQKRMKTLRKELRQERRHERRDIRRHERRDIRRTRQMANYYDNRRYSRAPVVVTSRRSLLPLFFPGIEVIIPLNW